ncbi:MAG: ABC transporter permease [Armatimonadetes bacterium]|nr:ABC transporter permease [Armatimonadota bacterium]
MKRLLWKEFRERWPWVAVLALSVLGVVVAGKGYTYCGSFETFTGWVAPSVLAALFLGMGAYSSELGWGTADFLHSRPITWKRILSAKLLFGILTIAIVCIVGAVLYRVTIPQAYAVHATVPALAEGAGIASLILTIAFLMGLVSSVVLPGAVGAALIFLAIVVGLGIEWAAVDPRARFEQGVVPNLPYWIITGWWLGASVAALVVLRFRITLPMPVRTKRYASMTLLTVAILSPLQFVGPFQHWEELFIRLRQFNSSPSGDYILVMDYLDPSRFRRNWTIRHYADREACIKQVSYMVRLSDGARGEIDTWRVGSVRNPDGTVKLWTYPVSIESYAWAGEIAYDIYYSSDPMDSNRTRIDLYKAWIDRSGDVRQSKVRLATIDRRSYRFRCLDSPDRRYFAVLIVSRNTGDASLKIFDMWLDITRPDIIPLDDMITDPKSRRNDLWWESNTEIGYYDREGKRHVISVGE